MEFHRSLWQTLVPPEAEPLRTGIDAEVLIIGSGIAGLLTAKKLTDYGVKNIAVIDAGPLCGGVTAHTTAKVTAQHGLCYKRLRDNFGAEKTAAYAAGNNQAVEQWAALAAAISESGGTYGAAFTRCPAVIYTRDDKRRKEFEKELEAAAEAGLDVCAVDDLPLPFETAAAIQLSNQAHVHPLEFCYGLIRQLMEQGVVFCPHT
ncbi:MAG: FAD-dependent oxidoreductase, partial [Oscillospiraceae bacterium]|nr:FAD-dependent oxidoreductase [Oscillospiraceae bacterium]